MASFLFHSLLDSLYRLDLASDAALLLDATNEVGDQFWLADLDPPSRLQAELDVAGCEWWLGLRDRRETHRKLAKITFPVWLYVSVTGIVVYAMLYVLPAPAG